MTNDVALLSSWPDDRLEASVPTLKRIDRGFSDSLRYNGTARGPRWIAAHTEY